MTRPARPKQSGAREAARGLPSLRFHHSTELRTRTLAVLDTLESADDPTEHREALAEVVMELTDVGLAYYFLKPVQDAKVGVLAMQTTKVGLAGILRVMSPVARRVLGGMDREQLLGVSAHIRELMD